MIVAAVTVDSAGDRLVLRPGPGSENALGRAIATHAQPIRVRRSGGRLTVAWPDADLLDAVPGLDLSWSVAARRWVNNRRRVRDNAAAVRGRAAGAVAAGAEAARALLGGHPWAAGLDDHQLINVAALTVEGGWGGCVFDEQGTGKTPTTIATFDRLHALNLVDVMVVVAPKSMVGEWPGEVRKFSEGLYRAEVITGSRQQKAAAIESGADVLVCNYETVASMLPNLALLAERARILLAVDESFFVKNPDSARTAAVRDLRELCTHAVVLCGTPAPNSPADLVAQFDLVDFGHTFAGVRLDKDRDIAAGQVRSVLDNRGFYLRSLKQIVLPHLPSRTFSEVPVDMQPEQAAAYAAALNDLILDLRDATDADYQRRINSFLERRAALLRICADPSALIPGYAEVPAKTKALDAVVDDLVARDEKMVIWSFYRASLDRLAQRYAHHGLVRIDGSVADLATRREAVRSFQEDAGTRIFLGNPAAAGAGLTLHAARFAIYESLSNQAAHFLQSLDRIHRRGQQREVEYITLLCTGTIEEPEYASLLQKADRQADLLGDQADPRPTRTVLIDELVGLLRNAPVTT